MKKYAVGVDIGGTFVKLGVFDTDGELLEKWEIPTVTEKGSEAIFDNIAESLQNVFSKRNIGRDEVCGIGMGVPAAVTQDGRMAKAVNISWDEMYPARELEKLVNIPVEAVNDANAAAFGEMWQGAAKGYENVVMVTLGTGVGGGIISQGRILVGACGGAGEIGHIHVNGEETARCKCGGMGCLEQYASATGVVRLANLHLAGDNRPSSLRSVEISAKSVFDAAKEKDEKAKEIVDEFGRYLAKGLGIVCTVVNPEAVVIGGGVSKAGEIILETIEPYFQRYVFPPCGQVRFMLARLGNDAGIFGAAGMILNKAGGRKC